MTSITRTSTVFPKHVIELDTSREAKLPKHQPTTSELGDQSKNNEVFLSEVKKIVSEATYKQQKQLESLAFINQRQTNELKGRLSALENLVSRVTYSNASLSGARPLPSVGIQPPCATAATLPQIMSSALPEGQNERMLPFEVWATNFFKNEEYEKAKRCYKLINEMTFPSAKGYIALCRAKESLICKEYEKAYEFFNESQTILEKTSKEDGYLAALVFLGEFYDRVKQDDHLAMYAYAGAYNAGNVTRKADSFIAKIFGSREAFIDLCKSRAVQILKRRTKEALEKDEACFMRGKEFLVASQIEEAKRALKEIPANSPLYAEASEMLLMAMDFCAEQKEVSFNLRCEYVSILSLCPINTAKRAYDVASFLYKAAEAAFNERNFQEAISRAEEMLKLLSPYLREQKIAQLSRQYKSLRTTANLELWRPLSTREMRV